MKNITLNLYCVNEMDALASQAKQTAFNLEMVQEVFYECPRFSQSEDNKELFEIVLMAAIEDAMKKLRSVVALMEHVVDGTPYEPFEGLELE